jgi:GT2 family glycosyltransferase
MGISRKAFEVSKVLHSPGEDPDLSIRLWNLGFETKLIPTAYVYHKRRIDWEKFVLQVNKFGKASLFSIVNPQYNKLTFFFPFFLF